MGYSTPFSSFSSTWIRCQVIVLSLRSHTATRISSPWTRYGRPERPDRVRQLRKPVHALLAVEHREGVGAVALKLLAVQIRHFTNLSMGTFRAAASFRSRLSADRGAPFPGARGTLG